MIHTMKSYLFVSMIHTMKMYLLCDVYSGVCLSEGLRVRIWSIRKVYDTLSLSIWMREDLTSLKRIKYQVKSTEDPHQI